MSGDFENLQLPPRFSGIVRLFPLPNLVLFPGVIQPLHIFEQRYRQMIEDALAADELIAIALMKPGWEPHYEGRPSIHETVCIGRIMTHSRLEDGRFNLLLQGLQRGKLVREIATDRLYRMAEVSVPSSISSIPNNKLLTLVARVRKDFMQLCERDSMLDEDAIQCLLGDGLRLESIADLIAFSLNAEPLVKQQVLNSEDLATRLRIVLQQIRRQLNQEPTDQQASAFPPCFSSN